MEFLAAGPPLVCVGFGSMLSRDPATLGVGPTPILRRRLTAENLGATLRATVGDAGMAARASELGVRIRAEDGGCSGASPRPARPAAAACPVSTLTSDG